MIFRYQVTCPYCHRSGDPLVMPEDGGVEFDKSKRYWITESFLSWEDLIADDGGLCDYCNETDMIFTQILPKELI